MSAVRTVCVQLVLHDDPLSIAPVMLDLGLGNYCLWKLLGLVDAPVDKVATLLGETQSISVSHSLAIAGGVGYFTLNDVVFSNTRDL